MEKKKGFRRNQLAAIFAALFCIVLFNSILIIKEKKKGSAYAFAYNDLNTSFSTFDGGRTERPATLPVRNTNNIAATHSNNVSQESTATTTTTTTDDNSAITTEPEIDPALMHAALNEAEAALQPEQVDKVKATIEATQKIIKNIEWKEINKTIADVMTEHEKSVAKQQYTQQLEQEVNWKNVESNMKANYNQLDWDKINANVDNALASIQLDSLQKAYSLALVEIQKANRELAAKGKLKTAPLPDQSVDDMQKSADVLRKRVATIKALRSPRKIVRL